MDAIPEVEESEILDLAVSKTIEMEEPKIIELNDPKATEMEGSKIIELDDPKATEMEGSKIIELDDPKTVEMEGSKIIDLDDSKTIEMEVSKIINLDNMKTIGMEGSKIIELDDPKTVEMEGSKIINLDDSKTLELEESKIVKYRGPKVLELEESKIPGVEDSAILEIKEMLFEKISPDDISYLDEDTIRSYGSHSLNSYWNVGHESESESDIERKRKPIDFSPNPISNSDPIPESVVLSRRLVGVIDEGTSTVCFTVYATPEFTVIADHKIDKEVITAQDGWSEQDPKAIINNVYRCCHFVMNKLRLMRYSTDDIITIAITNQRETTVVWDSVTGEPLYNAIVWNDIRTNSMVDEILAKLPEQNKNHFKSLVGLPMSPYFSALKIKWLKDNVPEVRKACYNKRCKFGTIDSWIVWNLTQGNLHITDVTNASRTMLMNIETLQWDPVLLKTFSIDIDMLPTIKSSSEIYGRVLDDRSALKDVIISGILGNQQASLLGQMCIKPGQTKNTYRSGCFLLCNTGTNPIISYKGLLTTVAYKLGPNAPAVYALEGAVAVAGHALEWLHNKVRLLPDVSDAEEFAETVTTTGDVYFVPSFTGLYAPYWRKDARGIIIGLTQYSTKYHIVRAALESICFQSRDILECMYKESGFPINKLHTDGSLSINNILMQLQADTAGVTVFRSKHLDSAAIGAAMCAAQAEGIELCKFDPDKRHYENIHYDTFLPTNTVEERNLRYDKWKRAVERSFDWVNSDKKTAMTEERHHMLSSVPISLFAITSFALFLHSLMHFKP